MALPDTLSGTVLVNFHKCPPIRAGGSTYLVLVDSTDQSLIEVWKNTNPGTDSWAEQDSSNKPTTSGTYNINAITCVLDGTNIHILSMTGDNSGAINDVDYHVFSTSTDTWSITDESVANNIDVNTAVTTWGLGIAVRSDGDVIAVYQGASDKIKGTDYGRIDFQVRVSGTWGSVTAVDDAGAVNYTHATCTLGASDKTHITYFDGTDIQHKSLSSADSLSSAETVNDTAIDTSNPQSSLSYFNDGTNDLVYIAWKKSSDSKAYTSTVTNDGTPSAETVVSDNTVYQDVLVLASDDANDTIHLLYADNTSQDLYHDENSGSGWGTDSLVLQDTGTNYGNGNNSGNIYGGTGTLEARAQSFQLSSGLTINDIAIEMAKTGSPSDNVYVVITSTIGGTAIATSNNVPASAIGSAKSWITFTFSSPPTLSASTTYYLEIYRTGARDTSNYFVAIRDPSGTYSSGTDYTRDSSTWTSASGDLNFRVPSNAIISIANISTGLFTNDSGDTVLAFVYNGDSTVKYDEYVVISSGITVNLGFISSATTLYSPTIEKTFTLTFISSATSVYALSVARDYALTFISSSTALYNVEIQKSLSLGFINSSTSLYAFTFIKDLLLGAIASSTNVYALDIQKQIDSGFITSITNVYSVSVEKSISPGFIASTSTIYALTASTSGITVNLGFISSSTLVYTLEVQKSLNLGYIASTSTLYNPEITKSLALSFLNSSTTLYALAIEKSIDLGFISGSSTLYALTIEKSIGLTFISSNTTLYSPTITTNIVVNLGFIASANALYSLTIEKTLSLGVIASTTSLYSVTIQRLISLGFIASSSNLYGLTLEKSIDLTFIASSTIVYSVSIGGTIDVNLTFISSSSALYSLTIQKSLDLSLISSVSSLYSLTTQKSLNLAHIATSSALYGLSLEKLVSLGFIATSSNVYAVDVQRLISLGFINTTSNLYGLSWNKSLGLTFIPSATNLYTITISSDLKPDSTPITLYLTALPIELNIDIGAIDIHLNNEAIEIDESIDITVYKSDTIDLDK